MSVTKSADISKQSAPVKTVSKQKALNDTLVDIFFVNGKVVYAEISREIEVILSHFSFHLSKDLNKVFCSMFHDSEKASQFTTGRIECSSYMINYGIAL